MSVAYRISVRWSAYCYSSLFPSEYLRLYRCYPEPVEGLPSEPKIVFKPTLYHDLIRHLYRIRLLFLYEIESHINILTIFFLGL